MENAPRTSQSCEEFFKAFISNCVFSSQLVYKVAQGNLKRPHKIEEWAHFAKNLGASFFNSDLTNDATISQIHLNGQYL
jgi:hypothetical protein